MILLKVNNTQVAKAQSNASYLREWGAKTTIGLGNAVNNAISSSVSNTVQNKITNE